ncbi:MAG TPA: VWA domain-containing protein [Terriglobia bacterium]|nr:VWA domain-containing protein [Terriglobia bacterium]
MYPSISSSPHKNRPTPHLPGRILVTLLALVSNSALWGGAVRSAQSDGPSTIQVAKMRQPSRDSSGTSTVFRKRVIVVNVPVTVLDKRGSPVIDLSEDDFHVFEDGKRQPITYFRQEPLPPLRIGLVLDTSNSMRPQMDFEKDAATQFVDNMLEGQNTRNQIFLETFDETSNVLQGFTPDPDLLEAKIKQLKAGGGKAMYDAIYFACKNLMMKSGDPENTRRLLVLISDGIDVSSTHTLDEAVSMAHRAQTSIYVVGNAPYGYSNPGDKYLNELADDTGGWAFFPLEREVGADLETGYLAHSQINDDGSQNAGLGARSGIYTAELLEHLADALEDLGRQLNSQYSIGYTPTDQNLDGTYRRIKVVVHRKGVRVRYKNGWFALAQQ